MEYKNRGIEMDCQAFADGIEALSESLEETQSQLSSSRYKQLRHTYGSPMGKPVYNKKMKQHPDGWLEQGKESRKFRKQLIIKRGTNVKDQLDEHSGHKMTMNTFNKKKIFFFLINSFSVT